MISNRTVSVVVPIYGVEAYLTRCVDSLLSQTYRDVEIILVDDGSPDRCGEICDSYAESDSRVRVIHQVNTGPGPSGARNAGLQLAQGTFVMFVDPDDWVHEEIVARLLQGLESNDADVAVCGFLRVRQGQSLPPLHIDGSPPQILGAREALGLYVGPRASGMTAPWAKLYRSSLLKGMEFPQGRLYEDEFFTYRVIARARTILLTDDRMYFYFVRDDSTTQRSQSARQLLDRADALDERGAFFRDMRLDHASAVSFQKSFLLRRSVRRASRESDGLQASLQLRRALASTIRSVQTSESPLAFKALATAYSVAPGLVDTAHAALRRFRSPAREPGLTQGGVAWAEQVHHASSVSPNAGGPSVEVVVVAYGSPNMLQKALEPVRDLPITVVDNSSLPEIRALSERLGCRYIDPGRNGGFAAGVNVGLAHRGIPGAEVLLLNPDAVIDADAVRTLHEALLASADLASVGPRQVDEHGQQVRVTWPFPSPWGSWLDALGLSRLRPTSEYVSGAILLLRAEALDAVGGLDERFFLYSEEADWAYRARRAGWRHAVIDSVTAMHAGGGTSSDETRRQAHFHASQERFLRKHYGAVGWQVARAGQILGDAVRSTIRGGPERDRLRARLSLYVKGPAHVEASLSGWKAGQ